MKNECEGFSIVKETMVVTRYHLVKRDGDDAINEVKECGPAAEYLHSCDDLHYDDYEITYEVSQLGEESANDRRLTNTARQINARLSENSEDSGLPQSGSTGIIKRRKKRKPPKFNVLNLLENVPCGINRKPRIR